MTVAVQFADKSTPGSNGPITAWAWDFGDGNTSTEENPVNLYESAGVFDVSLTVTDSAAGTDTVTSPVTVAAVDGSPTAGFRFVASGLDVTFTDMSSPGPSGAITGWHWDFGDGNTSTSENPSHTYAAAGTYTVTLTVTGTGGDGTAVAKINASGGGIPAGDYATDVAALSYDDYVAAGADAIAASSSVGTGGIVRHVVCTTKAQHDAAIADLTAGDWVDCQGIHFTGQIHYALSVADWAKITYDSACSFTGQTTQAKAPAIYITKLEHVLLLFDCDVTNKLGSYGILCYRSNQMVIDFLNGHAVHDCGADGIALLPAVMSTGAGDIENFFVRGEIYKIALHTAYDPHTEKGSGQHGCITSDAKGGVFHHGLLALYVHDCGTTDRTQGGGSGIELGLDAAANVAPAAPAHDIDIYLKVDRMHYRSLVQTGGNGINFFGVIGANVNVKIIEADDIEGHGINSDDGAANTGTRKSGVTVEAGTATSYCENPRYSGDSPWQEGGGINYGTMTPAAP